MVYEVGAVDCTERGYRAAGTNNDIVGIQEFRRYGQSEFGSGVYSQVSPLPFSHRTPSPRSNPLPLHMNPSIKHMMDPDLNPTDETKPCHTV